MFNEDNIIEQLFIKSLQKKFCHNILTKVLANEHIYNDKIITDFLIKRSAITKQEA
jgi:hypothetical protein